MNPTLETMKHAQDIIDYIEAHPEQHRQTSWVDINYDASGNVCGTTMCIAGTSVMLSEGRDSLIDMIYGVYTAPGLIPVIARSNLGLNEHESRMLFLCFDEERALNMLRAVDNGDETKFKDICGGTNGH